MSGVIPASPTLIGHHVRLESLARHHAAGLAAASAVDPSLYNLSPIPQGEAEALDYIDAATALRDAGEAVPYATVSIADGTVVGSTRFFNFDRWAWPQTSPHHSAHVLDGCEIGYTWLGARAIRTPVNTEAKLLMLTHAFEVWNTLRVCFHTDARNERSANALARIGAKPEGLLRAHRTAADFIPRDSLRFSITAAEWPEVKASLQRRLETT